MIRQLEIASADEAGRYDDKKDDKGWIAIATGDYEDILTELLTMLNDDNINPSNSWLRIVEPDHVRTF